VEAERADAGGYLRATNDDYWLVDEPNKNTRESVRRG
jgi:hypothetical protein